MLPPGRRDEMVPTSGESMHVAEWGPKDGRVVLLVHGNPTWGFLWRKVVAAIRARPGGEELRLIVPDLVGLGLSSRPRGAAHTLANHGAWLGAVLDKLAPGPIAIVGPDWGGPVALRAMVERGPPLRASRLRHPAIGPPAPT